MPVLEIFLFKESLTKASWIATVANSTIGYAFNGTTLAQQADAVQSLATAMQQGQANVIAVAPRVFGATPPPGISAEEFGETIATSLFETTQSLSVSGQVIFEVVEGAESLWLPDMLADAGLALLGMAF